MPDLKTFRSLSENDNFCAFANFVLTNRDENDVLRLDAINLMDIAALMDRVFIIDVEPNREKKLLFRYTGSALDREYDTTLTGHYFEDAYKGSDQRLIIGNLYDAIKSGRPAYLRQHIVLKTSYEKLRLVERLAFPASSNGASLDRLIGIVTFSPCIKEARNIAKLV